MTVPGDTLISGSKYLHLCSLARGGMGEVTLAVRQEGGFRRLYAIKRLHDLYQDDVDFRKMFLDEARLAGMVRHRNVVAVLDVGEDDGGPFQVMEYVEGPSVHKLLGRLGKNAERLPAQLALDIVAQACRGLHAAHELRSPEGDTLHLVHRDVSPQNLLIGFDGGVRVTDFGVAKALGQSTQTESGVLKGKMGYMSPEQLRFREIDRRSDLFAIGVVLFELLTGRRLYSGKGGRSGPLQILEGPVPDVSQLRADLPPDLVQLTRELLAKEPEDRPPTAKSVADRVEALLVQLRATEGSVDLGEYVTRWFGADRDAMRAKVTEETNALSLDISVVTPARGGRRWIVLGLAVGAVAVLGLIVLLSTSDSAPEESPGASAALAAPPSRDEPARDEAAPEEAAQAEATPSPTERAEPAEPEVAEPEPEPEEQEAASARRPTERTRRRTRPARGGANRTKSGQVILGWE
ncbi:MAG: serine/threonine-protein kinase [Sandaracinaceae bacterium]